MSAPKNEPDAMWTMVLLVAVLLLGGAIFWHFFRAPILEGLRWVRMGELAVVGLFSHQQDACVQWLKIAPISPAPTNNDVIRLSYSCFGDSFMATLPDQLPAKKSGGSLNDFLAPAVIAKTDFFTLNGTSMGEIERRATAYLRWPLVVAFLATGIYTLYFSPRGKFRTRHTLETFIRTQAKMWPVISPIVDFNPIKSSARIPGDTIPDKLPMFAESLSPEEWISWCRIPVTNGVVDREATRRALTMQLGPRWNGIDNQPDYIQTLLAAFALKGSQKREESDEFLGKIALCWSAKKGFVPTPELMSETKKILKDPAMGGKVEQEAAKHAYRSTALAGVLRWARSMGGVLAPAQFLWLRGANRSLWYTLNNVGRRSFHTEGMGAMAHYMAEQAAKKSLPIPRVDTAIVTLNQFLSDPEKRSIPIPPREGDEAKA